MIFDPLWLVMIGPMMLFALWAQARTQSTFGKYSKVAARVGLSGAQVARRLLDSDRLNDVPVEPVPSQLTDHYDPRDRTLRLSQPVHDSPSVAAIGVAAHEMGHALQHAQAYKPLMFRQAFYPVASFASRSWIWLFFGALFLPALSQQLIWGAVACLAAYALFAIVTLPVEFDASRRALVLLESSHILTAEELEGSRKVLNAAALTYVASAAQAVMMVVYMLLRARN
jgi:Zn-dependent membrane protease YugP